MDEYVADYDSRYPIFSDVIDESLYIRPQRPSWGPSAAPRGEYQAPAQGLHNASQSGSQNGYYNGYHNGSQDQSQNRVYAEPYKPTNNYGRSGGGQAVAVGGYGDYNNYSSRGRDTQASNIFRPSGVLQYIGDTIRGAPGWSTPRLMGGPTVRSVAGPDVPTGGAAPLYGPTYAYYPGDQYMPPVLAPEQTSAQVSGQVPAQSQQAVSGHEYYIVSPKPLARVLSPGDMLVVVLVFIFIIFIGIAYAGLVAAESIIAGLRKNEYLGEVY